MSVRVEDLTPEDVFPDPQQTLEQAATWAARAATLAPIEPVDVPTPMFALAEWAAGESGAYLAGVLTAIAEQSVNSSARLVAVTLEAARRVADEPHAKLEALTQAVTDARDVLAQIITALRLVDYPHERHLELDDILEDALAALAGTEPTGNLAPVVPMTVDEARALLGFEETVTA